MKHKYSITVSQDCASFSTEVEAHDILSAILQGVVIIEMEFKIRLTQLDEVTAVLIKGKENGTK